MEVACAACAAPLRREDLNFEYGIGTCRYCHAVTRLRDLPEQRPAPSTARPRVPMPETFEIEDDPHTLRIRWRWFTPMLFFMLFFCIAWNAFLLFWYGMLFGGMALDMPRPMLLLFAVFPIAHVAVGVGLAYGTVAGFLNRTTLTVDRHELSIRHEPMPWRGNASLPVDQVEQLYCQEKLHRGKQGPGVPTYNVFASLADGTRKKLVSGLTDLDQALFIEQAIEQHLGLADRRVAGEVPV